MITLQALSAYLTELYKPELFKDYGPNGLQVEGKAEVRKIGTAVSANLETIEAAVEKGIDCLICHHGLFWNNQTPLVVGPLKRKLQALLENGISLFAYHLPMDASAVCGNNFNAAADLGLTDACLMKNGIGILARAAELPRETFKKQLESYYGHPATAAERGADRVTRVAILSGGGWKCMEEAVKEGADAFVTGSFDEPAWSLAAELKLNFYAMGHSASERVGPRHLAEQLKKELSLESEFIEVYNPF